MSRVKSAKEDTTMYTQVITENGEVEHYSGFWEVKRIDVLDGARHKGIIAVQDEDVVRFFVYDRYYVNAIAEFYRYWKDQYKELPHHRIIDYALHNEAYGLPF